jgi:AcrR family transcriptional regulator
MANRMSPERLRSRGPKAPLSRDALIAAALECLRVGGVSGLTMRKVAGRLETGPASLYVYVRDQRELCALVLDAIVAAVPCPPAGAGGHEGVVELLLAYARQLRSFPGAARLALVTQPTGPAFLDLLESAMQLLVGAGFSVVMAARAGDALFLLTTASVAEQDARSADGPDRSIPELFDDALDASSTSRPLLSAGHDALRVENGELRLGWTLRALLWGVAQSPDDLGGPTTGTRRAARHRPRNEGGRSR